MARFSSIIRDDVRTVAAEMDVVLAKLAGTTLLVTGAAGFLCSYLLDLVAELNDAGLSPRCRVLGLDNFRSSLPERVQHLEGRSDISFVTHDIRQPYVPEGPIDWIVHGASIASPMFYRKYPLETIDANVTGTRNCLELARTSPVKSLLVMSTSEIYGDPDPAHIPTSETYNGNVSCTGPRACYDESKRLSETLSAVYFQQFNTPVKVGRPFNVYGPGQRLDDARIIPDLMSAALERRPIVLYSDGRATRSFCYVRDAIAAMMHILLSDANGQAFNLGNDAEELSMRAVADLVSQLDGPPALPVEFRASADVNYVVDNPQRRCPDLRKLKALATWQPTVQLAEGLRRTLTSYRETAKAASA